MDRNRLLIGLLGLGFVLAIVSTAAAGASGLAASQEGRAAALQEYRDAMAAAREEFKAARQASADCAAAPVAPPATDVNATAPMPDANATAPVPDANATVEPPADALPMESSLDCRQASFGAAFDQYMSAMEAARGQLEARMDAIAAESSAGL